METHAQVPEPYRKRPALRAGLFVRANITGNTDDNVFVLERHTVRRGNEVALAVEKVMDQMLVVVAEQEALENI